MEKEGKVNKALAELKDAQRVVIYHESYLFPGNIEELKRDYEKAGLLGEFRAKDLYENKRIVPVGSDIAGQ